MRLQPDTRKDQILTAALHVAGRRNGWNSLTREAVAREAQCAESLVSRYFGTMTSFRRDIMRAAISRRELGILAQGLACGDKHAAKAPPELKTAAIHQLAGE